MSDDQQGFTIYGKFFPFISYEEWLNRDFTLARQLTGVTTEELFGDPLLMQQALVAVAVSRESPAMPREAVVDWVGSLKPGEIEESGFDRQERLSPLPSSDPSENGDSSKATSDDSSVPTQETSLTGSSTEPGSATGSPE